MCLVTASKLRAGLNKNEQIHSSQSPVPNQQLLNRPGLRVAGSGSIPTHQPAVLLFLGSPQPQHLTGLSYLSHKTGKGELLLCGRKKKVLKSKLPLSQTP